MQAYFSVTFMTACTHMVGADDSLCCLCLTGAVEQVGWSRIVAVTAHAGLGALLALRARQTDLTDSKSLYSCYMFVWKLFYLEYLILPLLR